MRNVTVYTCEQGTPEWHEARRGIPTASCFSDILAKGQGKTRRKYLLTLAGEILTGEVTPGFTNAHMERGHAMEDEARRMYAFMRDTDPVLVGFMRRDRTGASPDSLIGEDGLLEIKTKLPHLQLEALESRKLPSDHVAQVQGQLWVSGREWCDFVSYWPRMPLFTVRVERDEPYIEKLEKEVAAFLGELDLIVSKYSQQQAA